LYGAKAVALAFEIEARDASRLGEATELAAEAIAQRFGRGAVDGKIQAHIVTIENRQRRIVPLALLNSRWTLASGFGPLLARSLSLILELPAYNYQMAVRPQFHRR